MTIREQLQKVWEKIVEKGYKDYSQLNENERIWFNIESITTSGLIDHYINYGAEHNSELIEDLEYLGFKETSDLFHQINKLFDSGAPPMNIDKRNEEIHSWGYAKNAILEQNEKIFWSMSDNITKALELHISKAFL